MCVNQSLAILLMLKKCQLAAINQVKQMHDIHPNESKRNLGSVLDLSMN